MPRRQNGSSGSTFHIRESGFSRRRIESVASSDDSGSDGFGRRGRCSVRTFPFFRSRSRSRSRSWSRSRPSAYVPRSILRNNYGSRRRPFPSDFTKHFDGRDDDDDDDDDGNDNDQRPRPGNECQPPRRKRHTTTEYCTCDKCRAAEERNEADHRFYQELKYREEQDRKADVKWKELGDHIRGTIEATKRRNEQKAWLTDQINGRSLEDIDADIAACNANLHRVGAIRQLVDLNRPRIHERSASVKSENRVRWAYPLTEYSEHAKIVRDDGYCSTSYEGGR